MVIMNRLLSILVFLALTYCARAQQARHCSLITLDDMLSTDNSLQSSLLVQTYNKNVNPTDPFIQVDDFHIVCEAVATRRDTYRYVSVVVRQTCSGFNCPVNDGIPSLVQYDFECSAQNEWIPMSFGSSNIREDDPEADFDTELRQNCSACARQLVGADSVTHCRSCASGCTDGLRRCSGFGSGCCTYYFEDLCVEHCPLDSHVIDSDFNCGEPEDCPELESPQNGIVTAEDRIYPNEATYECDDGFELDGVDTRKCQISGSWADEAPKCVTAAPPSTPSPTPTVIMTESGRGGISNTELGVVIAVVVLFFLIVAGVFIAVVAVWTCNN